MFHSRMSRQAPMPPILMETNAHDVSRVRDEKNLFLITEERQTVCEFCRSPITQLDRPSILLNTGIEIHFECYTAKTSFERKLCNAIHSTRRRHAKDRNFYNDLFTFRA